MFRNLFIVGVVALAPSFVGCAMCENCLDDEYGAYGGCCEDGACDARSNSRFGSRFTTTAEPIPMEPTEEVQPIEPAVIEPTGDVGFLNSTSRFPRGFRENY